MIRTSLTLLALPLLFSFLAARQAVAMDLLMHGVETQSSGGLGITSTKEAPSLLYNPASLGRNASPRIIAETGFLSLNYSYTYPDFDPAKIVVNTPFVLLGTSWAPVPWLTLGTVLFPIPAGGKPLRIENVPSRQLSSEPSLIDVESENIGTLGYTAAAGLSLINGRYISIGASWIRKKSNVRTTISDSETGTEIFSFDAETTSDTGLFGLNLRPLRNLQLSATWQTLTKIVSEGEFLNENGEEFSRRAHVGREFGGGLKMRFAPVTGWAEVLFRKHSENSGNLSPFAPDESDANEPESYNAFSFATGLELSLGGKQAICAGYGWHPTTVGAGTMAEDPADEIPGFQFGDMDAISRHVAGAGFRRQSGRISWKFSGSYQSGYRYVSEESREAGDYNLKVYTLTGSISASL